MMTMEGSVGMRERNVGGGGVGGGLKERQCCRRLDEQLQDTNYHERFQKKKGRVACDRDRGGVR